MILLAAKAFVLVMAVTILAPKTKAKYWSCKMWSKKSVTKVTKGSSDENELLNELDESEALSDKQKKLSTCNPEKNRR